MGRTGYDANYKFSQKNYKRLCFINSKLNPLKMRRKQMEEVIKIFNQIQNTSSTNVKKTIIAANKDNELFKNV